MNSSTIASAIVTAVWGSIWLTWISTNMVPVLGLTDKPPVTMLTIWDVVTSAADLNLSSSSVRQYLGFMENGGGTAFSIAWIFGLLTTLVSCEEPMILLIIVMIAVCMPTRFCSSSVPTNFLFLVTISSTALAECLGSEIESV